MILQLFINSNIRYNILDLQNSRKFLKKKKKNLININFFKFFQYNFDIKYNKLNFKSILRFFDIIKFFFGLNLRLFCNMFTTFGFSFNFFFYNISKEEFKLFFKFIFTNFTFGQILKLHVIYYTKIKTLNGCLVGKRLKQGLPTKGQRTRSNAKTCKRIKFKFLSLKDKDHSKIVNIKKFK